MDCNKPLVSFFLIFVLIHGSANFVDSLGLDVALTGGPDTACLQKLIPCKDFVKSTSPPSSCCDPIKELISTDTQCLCKVFNDPGSLGSLSITQADALGLAKTCGSNPDVSVCKTESGSSNSTSAATGNTTTSSAPPILVVKSGGHALSSHGGLISSASTALSAAFFGIFYSL